MPSPTPDKREAELQKQLDGMSRGSINHEPVSRELILLRLEKLKKPHWSVVPSFVLLVVTVVLAALALPQVQAILPVGWKAKQSSGEKSNSASQPARPEQGKDRR